MKLFFSTTLSTAITGGLVGCTGGGLPDADSQGAVLEGLSTTAHGEISLMNEKRGAFVAGSADGVHTYTMSGRAGSTLNFVLSSHSFRTHLLVVGPSGHRWSVPGTLFVYSESQAWREITLPQDGTYRILVTSHENLAHGRALSSGDYSLEVFGDPHAVTTNSTPAASRVIRPRS